MTDELWRPVLGFDGYYEVSSLGQVRGIPRAVTVRTLYREHQCRIAGRVLAPHIRNGYAVLMLYKDNVYDPRKVHRLVAESFHENLEQKPFVAHNNGIKLDNRSENLRWATAKENVGDRTLHGTDNRGERCANAKLSARDITRIRALLPMVPQKEIAGIYGVDPSAISHIKRGRNWRYV